MSPRFCVVCGAVLPPPAQGRYVKVLCGDRECYLSYQRRRFHESKPVREQRRRLREWVQIGELR